jgi:hypothetical protein
MRGSGHHRGTHATYQEYRHELAEIVCPFLRQISGVRT